MARRVELWDDNRGVKPNALAARAAVFAFGDELKDLRLPDNSNSQWLSQGGRDMAAAHLLPRAEAALRQELQRKFASARWRHDFRFATLAPRWGSIQTSWALAGTLARRAQRGLAQRRPFPRD
jgi:hypothetical protein